MSAGRVGGDIFGDEDESENVCERYTNYRAMRYFGGPWRLSRDSFELRLLSRLGIATLACGGGVVVRGILG